MRRLSVRAARRGAASALAVAALLMGSLFAVRASATDPAPTVTVTATPADPPDAAAVVATVTIPADWYHGGNQMTHWDLISAHLNVAGTCAHSGGGSYPVSVSSSEAAWSAGGTNVTVTTSRNGGVGHGDAGTVTGTVRCIITIRTTTWTIGQRIPVQTISQTASSPASISLAPVSGGGGHTTPVVVF